MKPVQKFILGLTAIFGTPIFGAPNPFSQCPSHHWIRAGELGSKHRKEELAHMEERFKKQYPMALKQLITAFGKLRKTPPTDADHQTVLEELVIILNQLDAPELKKKAKSQTPVQQIHHLWQSYPTPKSRSPIAMNSADECMSKPDRIFTGFAKKMTSTMRVFLGPHAWAKAPLDMLNKTQMAPAGSRTFFGATAGLSPRGKPRICINPEESPPFLLPKLMHELVHAQNHGLMKLRTTYKTKVDQLIALRQEVDKADEILMKFDDQLTVDSPLYSTNLVELALAESPPYNRKTITALMKKLAGKRKNYRALTNENGIKKQAPLLLTWLEKYKQEEAVQNEVIPLRIKLDREGFYDEHRAYLMSLQVAESLVAEHEAYFCRLWVPSYAQKRPVYFYQAYQDLQKRIRESSFSTWLGSTYTFKSKRYLPESLYQGGAEAKGLLPEVAKQASAILTKKDTP